MRTSAPDARPTSSSIAIVAHDRDVQAFIRYLAGRGISLVPDEGNWWRVDPPPGDGYDMLVAIRAFPRDASEEEMRRKLLPISLAFMLNTRARLAMSYPSARGPLPQGTRFDEIPVGQKLIAAFDDYNPGQGSGKVLRTEGYGEAKAGDR